MSRLIVRGGFVEDSLQKVKEEVGLSYLRDEEFQWMVKILQISLHASLR